LKRLFQTVLAKIYLLISLANIFAAQLHACELKLPEAVSNNAVTIASVDGELTLFSFNGLGDGKTYQDVHGKAFSVNLKTKKAKIIASLPDGLGRLASIAVTLNNRILVIGGYTVAKDHAEVSTSQVFEYFPLKNKYQKISDMPVPVDDTVAFIYQQRYVYLVSGWHDTANVNLVQVFDSKERHWFNATPFPGAPVFGHAGGIVGNKFLIVDGVKVKRVVDGKREYGPSDETWYAEIDKNDPAVIYWKKISKHPFKPLYRMASVGVPDSQQIVFAGGSDNPYNYNGVGYNGIASEPSSKIFSYDVRNSRWQNLGLLNNPSMDHRGLLLADDGLYIVGGMGKEQEVLNAIQKIDLSQVISGLDVGKDFK